MRIKEVEYTVNENGCHICFSHSKDRHGYPQISVIKNGKRTMTRLIRTLWEQNNSSIPDGLCVLHSCDTPACINLNHAWLGTQLENIQDCVNKRRLHVFNGGQAGEKNNHAKLNNDDITYIRKVYTSVRGVRKRLAQIFNVDADYLTKIAHGKRWSHL